MPSFKSLLMTATLASLSAAHVVLENPKPYKFVADGPTNPISSTGSDFPCKIPPGQSYIIDGEPTPMTIGEDQTLSFQGHAVHGGGSCQLALSRGFPTKDSPWMVIHSIEGGCPARGQKGNLEGPNKDKYTFKIPEGIEPGTNWTLAWSWQSRIGGGPEFYVTPWEVVIHREQRTLMGVVTFYMNCAPITILPSTKKRTDHPAGRRYAVSKRNTEFPELFMANMGEFAGGCTTSDAQRVQIPIAYPNPGASVDRPEGDNLFKQMCDGNPRAKKAPAAGNGDGNGGASGAPPTEPSSTSSSAAPSSSSSASSSPAASSSAAPTSSAAPEATFIITSSTPSSSTPSSSTPTTPSSAIASASASTSTSAQTPSSSAAPPTCGGGQCTEGHLTCLEDGTHFATCTGGQLTAHQPTPPGYKCKPGSGLGLEISPM
ncbi:hypothetical protein F5Y07DRAFT_401142 [Xylaria sp. FL0933]|nr:hypothetical protein F5Y07DRAFT_401142 [Xylaria sp. FL0933]